MIDASKPVAIGKDPALHAERGGEFASLAALIAFLLMALAASLALLAVQPQVLDAATQQVVTLVPANHASLSSSMQSPASAPRAVEADAHAPRQ
jgi:hypothetical protein